MKKLLRFGSLIATAGAMSMPASAWADEANSGSADIVVTAQKREQSAQEVPISLTALSGETVERQGITSIQELGNSVAGVNIAAANPGAMRLVIRGVSDVSSSNQSASVNGFYVDETVMSYVPGYMPEVSLMDIERVEVLRGPQGTLFGEGSLGGTLRVITRKPDSTNTFVRIKAGAYATKGGGQGYSGQANANIPLVRDLLAVTVAGSYRDLPGWIDIPDISIKDSNTSKLKDGRIAARLTPSSSLTIDAFYQISRSKIFDFVTTDRYELNPGKANVPGGPGPVSGLSPSEGRLDIGALTVSYDVGPATLVAASSLTTSTYDTTRNLTTIIPVAFPSSWVPNATAQSIFRVRSHALTQEIRLVSNGAKKINWTIGGYYKHEDRDSDDGYIFDIPAISYVDQPLSHSDQKGNSWAVFGDIDYKLSEQLSLQAGLRYFEDDSNFVVTQVSGSRLPLGFAPADFVQSGTNHSNATSPKVGLTYKISPKALVFAKFSKGFRSGGANTAPLAVYPYATSQYGPDSLNAYEIGLKTSPLQGMTLNVYVFHNDWKDVQLPFRTADGRFGYVQNAGDAKVDGLEVELSHDITPSFNVGLTYAYNNAKISNDVRDSFGQLIVAAGSQLPTNSKNKVTATTHYERALGRDILFGFDARYRWASKNFSDPGNTPIFENGSTSQLFLSTSLSGQWGKLTFFVDNVLDRADSTAKYPPIGAAPVYTYTNFLRPRNFGLELKREL
jgi:outer membrane receptor protein involved in Fe transport